MLLAIDSVMANNRFVKTSTATGSKLHAFAPEHVWLVVWELIVNTSALNANIAEAINNGLLARQNNGR